MSIASTAQRSSMHMFQPKVFHGCRWPGRSCCTLDIVRLQYIKNTHCQTRLIFYGIAIEPTYLFKYKE